MSEVLDDNLEKEENSNGFQLDFEEITPWNGANDTGKDVRMKWLRNFEKIRQNFELLSGLWSLKIDSDGKKYAYTNFPIVGAAGMTMFAGEEIKVDSIFKGLPIDTETLQWVDGVLTVVGGTGGGEAGFVKWQNIEGKPSWITSEKPKYSYTEITGLTEELEKYVTLSTDQSVTGMKDFANGMKVSGVLFKVINGVLTLDCSIAVTGGITTHAIGEQTAATIMDGVAVDGITITKEDGVLKVGGGGASNWDELEGKPSWITDIKPVYAWGEITQKPATLSGYGIQASDVLNTLKTVDGSGSGLDADTLDGVQGERYLKQYSNNTPSGTGNIKFSEIDNISNSENSWNNPMVCSLKLQNWNNTLCINIGGIVNDRNANIQVGHSDLPYAGSTGNLYLNKFGGSVYIGTTLAATINSNVASATKLQTARTLWGQSFDGTANVTGSLTSVTDITGTGTFTGANIKATDSIYVNGIQLHKTAEGVITLEGNLAVTGGITQFAVNEVNSSTIMDGVVVDGTSIKKENGVLKVMNAGGGEAGSVKWANIDGKPTTLAGYSITASDVLSTLKTVDGSGSGLDADMLDGYHESSFSQRNDVSFTTNTLVEDWVKSNSATQRAGNIFSVNGWTWSNDSTLKLTDSISVTRMRYSALSIRNGNLNVAWQQQALLFLPTYQDSKMIYLAQMNTERTAGSVNTSIKRYADYDTIINGNVASATKLQTPRQINGTSFDGTTDITTAKWGTSRTISLGNYLSGYVSLNGSSNVTLNATVIGLTSQGNKTAISGTTMPSDGIRLYQVYNNGYPCTYGNLISVKGLGAGELLLEWTGSSTLGHIRYRSKRDNNYNGWSSWGTVAFTTDNVASATKLKTARTIWGQSFDGTANVSGSLTGVTNITASGSISCGSLRTTEATINGALTVPYSAGSWISMATRTNIIQSTYNQTEASAHGLYRVKTYNGHAVVFGGLGDEVGFYGFYKSRIDSNSNGNDWFTIWSTSDGTLTHKGNLLVTGGGTFYSSDIRAKTIIERPKLSLNSIANAPVIKFRWNGYNGLKDDNKQHVGGIAQYIEKILPECVIGQKDDFLSFDYATTGYVFSVLTARHLLSYETRTDLIIRKLKERIRRLERQLNIENHEEVCIVAD
jgi:hypothetical protein